MASGQRRIGSSIAWAKRCGRATATLAAVLILAAQFLTVAHYHQSDPVRRIDSQAQVVADDGLCALCILAFHVPLNPAAVAAVEQPHADAQPIAAVTVRAAITGALSSCQSRAPPRLAV